MVAPAPPNLCEPLALPCPPGDNPAMRDTILDLADSPIVEVWRLGQGDPDVIGLWAGESDLPTPRFISDAATAALQAGGHTFYTPNRGIPPLRQALSRYLERVYGIAIPDGRLAITASGMSAVMLTCQGLLSPGDHAVAVTPSWPNVLRAMTICGATVTEIALRPRPDGWHLDLAEVFAACTDRTRIIYYASPGNPTGFMLEQSEISSGLLVFARSRGIAIMADEVYHRLVYDRAVAPSILTLATPQDRVYAINTFSKSWAMTGWRMGWVVFPETDTFAFEKLIQFNVSGTPGFLQMGAAAALDHGEAFVGTFVERCRRRSPDRARRPGGDRARQHRAQRRRLLHHVRGPRRDRRDALLQARGDRGARGAWRRAPRSAAAQSGMIRLCHAQSPDRMRIAMERLGGVRGELRRVGAPGHSLPGRHRVQARSRSYRRNTLFRAAATARSMIRRIRMLSLPGSSRAPPSGTASCGRGASARR